MADVLVVYFSRSGRTEQLARQLAEKLGAELDEVKPIVPYSGAGGYLKGIWHSLLHRAPLVQHGRPPSSYGLVIIGSPVWAGHLSATMRSYLTQFHSLFAPCAAYWVSGSGRGYEVLSSEIEQLAGRAPFVTASFSEGEVDRGAADAKLETFAQAIRNHYTTLS